MAIPNLNKILEAQAVQRGYEEKPDNSSDSKDDVMEILQLIFEYMKENNKNIHQQFEKIYQQEEMILKEIERLNQGNSDNER